MLNPRYGAADPLTPVVRSAGAARVRVEVESESGTSPADEFLAPIWATVSLTNNTTQQVTVISPQP